MSKPSLTYASAGVSFDANSAAMERIKKAVRSTHRPEVLSSVGSFGGLFQLGNYRRPILVSSTDGVGTKLKIAFMTDQHNSIGYDLVAHCGNDIVVQGAEPLFFLDYIGTSNLDQDTITAIVEGLADGCREIGCTLIGGETAEMPGFYNSDEYDLVGTIVGVVERDDVITGDKIQPNDQLIGLPSIGLHTNGYSLARKIIFEHCGYAVDQHFDELGTTIGYELLKNHKSYVRSILSLKKRIEIKGIAHITGGGLPDNVIRILPENCRAEIQKGSWEILPIFDFLQDGGNVTEDEMFRVFNMGLGLVIVVSESDADQAISILTELNESPKQIGKIVAGDRGVLIV